MDIDNTPIMNQGYLDASSTTSLTAKKTSTIETQTLTVYIPPEDIFQPEDVHRPPL